MYLLSPLPETTFCIAMPGKMVPFTRNEDKRDSPAARRLDDTCSRLLPTLHDLWRWMPKMAFPCRSRYDVPGVDELHEIRARGTAAAMVWHGQQINVA